MNALEKHAAKSALKQMMGRGLETLVRKGTPHRAPASILAHELGHAKTLRGSSKTVRKLRMFGYGAGPTVAQLINKHRRFTRIGKGGNRPPSKKELQRLMVQDGAVQAAGEAPRLAEEFLATYHGLKALKKLKGIAPKTYKKARGDLLWADTTYLSGASGNVAAAAMGAKAARMGESTMSPMLKAKLVGMGPQLLAVSALKRGIKDTPTLGFFGRRRLHKMMGAKDLVNLQPKRGKRSPMGAFFMPDTSAQKISPAMEKAWRKRFGDKAIDRMKRDGAISVPLSTRGELGGKKGVQDKLLELARKMQKG